MLFAMCERCAGLAPVCQVGSSTLSTFKLSGTSVPVNPGNVCQKLTAAEAETACFDCCVKDVLNTFENHNFSKALPGWLSSEQLSWTPCLSDCHVAAPFLVLVGLGCSCGIGSVGFVFPVVVGRCGPEWRLHFWCLWGWVAAVGLIGGFGFVFRVGCWQVWPWLGAPVLVLVGLGCSCGIGSFGFVFPLRCWQVWPWMVAPFLGMVGFGTVKFWDDGFEQLMEESPNSQLRMPFLT